MSDPSSVTAAFGPGVEAPVLSRAAFLALSPRALMRSDQPFVVDWIRPPVRNNTIERICELIGSRPVALFQKSADPGSIAPSVVSQIPLANFFTNAKYRAADSGVVYRGRPFPDS